MTEQQARDTRCRAFVRLYPRPPTGDPLDGWRGPAKQYSNLHSEESAALNGDLEAQKRIASDYARSGDQQAAYFWYKIMLAAPSEIAIAKVKNPEHCMTPKDLEWARGLAAKQISAIDKQVAEWQKAHPEFHPAIPEVLPLTLERTSPLPR